jgi:hypothetical protein
MPLVFLTYLSYKSLRLVECSEFWCLLLFRHCDLRDSDIPHWSKIWDLVIALWSTYFNELKLNLEVRLVLLWLELLVFSDC